MIFYSLPDYTTEKGHSIQWTMQKTLNIYMQKNKAETLPTSNNTFCMSKDTIQRVKMQPLRNGCEKNNLKNLQLSDISVDFIF